MLLTTPKDVLYGPRKFTWHSAPSVLHERELDKSHGNAFSAAGFSPGFSPDDILQLKKDYSFKHRGRDNCSSFNDQGTLLVTVSADLNLKIWTSSSFVDGSA